MDVVLLEKKSGKMFVMSNYLVTFAQFLKKNYEKDFILCFFLLFATDREYK